MDGRQTQEILRRTTRELVCCVARVVARHQVPDDVVWEIVKGFDVIYHREKARLGHSRPSSARPPGSHRLRPHPGIAYLLDRLEDQPRVESGKAAGNS